MRTSARFVYSFDSSVDSCVGVLRSLWTPICIQRGSAILLTPSLNYTTQCGHRTFETACDRYGGFIHFWVTNRTRRPEFIRLVRTYANYSVLKHFIYGRKSLLHFQMSDFPDTSGASHVSPEMATMLGDLQKKNSIGTVSPVGSGGPGIKSTVLFGNGLNSRQNMSSSSSIKETSSSSSSQQVSIGSSEKCLNQEAEEQLLGASTINVLCLHGETKCR